MPIYQGIKFNPVLFKFEHYISTHSWFINYHHIEHIGKYNYIMVKNANIFVIQHKITIHIKCIHSIHFLSIYVYSPILYAYKYIFLKIIIILL